MFRVLDRIFLSLEHAEARLNNDQMLALAEEALPPGKAYDWNQALMDLGATICTSNNPQCVHCPLQELCNAYAEMRQQSLFPSGAVLRQMRKVAEKKATYQAQPFTSKNRYFRARIVDHLRSLPPGKRISLSLLDSPTKPRFTTYNL